MNDADSLGRLSRRRHWTNRITETVVGIGGGAVIAAITLIFAYLLWVVAPIFKSADIEQGNQFRTAERPTALVDISENGEVVSRFSSDGIVEFYDQASGRAWPRSIWGCRYARSSGSIPWLIFTPWWTRSVSCTSCARSISLNL